MKDVPQFSALQAHRWFYTRVSENIFPLGDQSLEDVIIDTVKSFLATLFEFGNGGTVRINGNAIYENITIEGDANIRNLKVEGSTKFESDLTTTGTITAYGGFTSADPNSDMNVDFNTDPNAIPDADPNFNQHA